VNIAALRRKHATDRVKIHWIRNQRVQRIGRYRDDFATAHGGCGAFNRGFGRTLGVNLDEIGCHRISLAVSGCYSRSPMASATSIAI